jgi:hypothetical protein
MKRVLLLFGFLAFVLAGVASASRDAGPCCPAGAAAEAQVHAQGHGDAHKKDGCCGPKAEGERAAMCMRGENGPAKCCATDADNTKGCCAEGACAMKQEAGRQCCEKKAEGQEKAGCCQKKDGEQAKAGCCAKHGAGS